MELNSRSYREKLYNQIEESFAKVVYTYTTHIIQAARIQKHIRRMKWAELILSAISTGGFLATVISEKIVLAWVGGLCSTALLVLTAYFKEMDLAQKLKEHKETSDKLWVAREDYISLMIDFEIFSNDEVIQKRELLKTIVQSIYEVAPITDNKSYELAKKAIKDGESQFFTQEELNQMLPLILRK